eukprot:15452476-Alexandrium_andersonii.AAC.1
MVLRGPDLASCATRQHASGSCLHHAPPLTGPCYPSVPLRLGQQFPLVMAHRSPRPIEEPQARARAS